jgi:polysaccharide biosynthesis transport protein
LLDSQIGSLIELWRKQYDFVLLDGPPLLPVTDGQIIHPLVDITLLLSRTGLTERGQLLRSYRILTEPNKHFVGVIVNGLRPEDESYYGYYGYRQYSYKYSEDPNAKTK